MAKDTTSGEIVALFKESSPDLKRLEVAPGLNEETLHQVKGGMDKNQTEVAAFSGSCNEFKQSQLQMQGVIKHMAALTVSDRSRVGGIKNEINQLQEKIKGVVSDVERDLADKK